MAAERSIDIRPEPMNYERVLKRIPEAVSFAKIEAEAAQMAKTAEGKFALTYLLTNRNLLQPILSNLSFVSPDLLQPIGGPSYNPERSIDDVGSAVARYISQQTEKIPNFFMRTEESARWENMGTPGQLAEEGERFAIIDPLDMTHGIVTGNRVQTTGIAIYNKTGDLHCVGIISLVDDHFLFIENDQGKLHIYPSPGAASANDTQSDNTAIRMATLTRRMQYFQDIPFLSQGGVWTMDAGISGYPILALQNNTLDTVIDHVKGSAWYELVIWARAAQVLGFSVSDKDGNPIDIPAIMRRVIKRHEGDTHRVPVIISRTPEIHKRVLSLLKPQPTPHR